MTETVGTGAFGRAEPWLSVRFRVANENVGVGDLSSAIARTGMDDATLGACVDAARGAWADVRNAVGEAMLVVAPVRSGWGAWVDVTACGVVRGRAPGPNTTTIAFPTRDDPRSAWCITSRRVTMESRVEAPLDVACAMFSHPGEITCGDGVCLDRVRGDAVRALMVDVLGHGPRAAHVRRELLVRAQDLSAKDPVDLVRTLHGHAQPAARGAALAVLEISSQGEGTYVGVGNVDAFGIGAGPWLSAQPGTVGLALPRLQPERFVLARGSSVVLHTDGLSPRRDATAAIGNISAAETLAFVLATANWRPDDIAIVVVRRPS